MKTATFIATILSLAVAATAAPAIEERWGGNNGNGGKGGSGSKCSANNKQVCCNGILDCVVAALSTTCSGNAYCCNTEAPEASPCSWQVDLTILISRQGAIVDVALLDCVNIL